MREAYVTKYAEGTMLRASLDLLWHSASWPPPEEEAITMTEWGPLFLTNNNAPYVPTFIRAADRALYHATNAWRQLAADLSVTQHMPYKLEADARMQTNDRSTKYEKEAFLGSVVAITDEHLIGVAKKGKHNRLGKSPALGELLIAQLRAAANDFHTLGFESKWREVRNSAYHLTPEMTDWGFLAQIRKQDECYVVELPGIHNVEGAPTDLVQLLNDSYDAFAEYIALVRDLLTQFSFQHILVPRHNTYINITDPLGNMIVGLGKDGYELRHFPETSPEVVGASKAN